MCLWELWIYLKCTLSTDGTYGHHQILYPVAPCPTRRNCTTPTLSNPDELKIVRRDRYCPSCFEALRNTIGGCGEMCWPCNGGVEEHYGSDDLEWSWDDRLAAGRELVDFMPADGSDAGMLPELAMPGKKVHRVKDSRFRAVGRSWKGWEDF